MARDQKNFEEHYRKSLNCLEQTVSRNMDVKRSPSKGSDRSEENVTGNWRKEDSCCTVAESSGECCPGVIWKL